MSEDRRVRFFGGELPVLADETLERRLRMVEDALMDYEEMDWADLDALRRELSELKGKLERVEAVVEHIYGWLLGRGMPKAEGV